MPITPDQMEEIRQQTKDIISSQTARAKAAQAKMKGKGTEPVGPVEPGLTTIHLKRRPVPAHLEHVGRSPEKVVIGEKRTDWDPIKDRKP